MGLSGANRDISASTVDVTYVNIDRRKNDQNTTVKALCVILYSLGKGTYRFLGQIFGVAHTTIYR